MLKLTRLAAMGLIALAVVLALAAFALSRRAPASNVVPSTVDNTVTPQDVPVLEVSATLDRGQLAQGYAMQLNPGERALAVPVDEFVAAGNRILPGDYVDVFLNLRAPSGINTDGQAQARLLLSRLRVLSYGATDTAPAAAANSANPANGDAADSRAADIQGSSAASGSSSNSASAPARSAVLAVPVEEANRLLLGAQQGKLFLALRNPTDVGLPDQDLFAPSVAVLSPRRALSPEQQLALASPENDAFAGIDADALAGRRSGHGAAPATVARAAAPVRRSATRLSPGVEIIRGEPSSHSGSR